MLQLQRVGSHGNSMPKIKTIKRLSTTRGGAFVAWRFSNYNRGNGYIQYVMMGMGEHLLHAKPIHSRRKSIPRKGITGSIQREWDF